jgi:hypothetical protein
MRCRKVSKLRALWGQLRRQKTFSRQELVQLTQALGRVHAGGKKEPAFVNPEMPKHDLRRGGRA